MALSVQIERYPDLQPISESLRNSPIAGVLLTNADLDHALGLFCLREASAINLYASDAVRNTLDSCLGLGAVLGAFSRVTWHEPPRDKFEPLANEQFPESGLFYRTIGLRGEPPPFSRAGSSIQATRPAKSGIHSAAYQFLDPRTGGRLLVAPDVGSLDDELRKALSESDAVLFDGTFWSEEELSALRPGARTAGQMGHVTIRDQSLDELAKLSAKRKIYIHLNNTNPVLAAKSPERTAVEAAGIVVGEDGMEFEL